MLETLCPNRVGGLTANRPNFHNICNDMVAEISLSGVACISFNTPSMTSCMLGVLASNSTCKDKRNSGISGNHNIT